MGSLYRTVMAVSVAGGDIIPAGVTTRLAGISSGGIAQLLERDAISEVHEPPLAILPQWVERANRLRHLGITTPLQLVDASVAELSRSLRLRPSTIKEWQVEALQIVMPAGASVYEAGGG